MELLLISRCPPFPLYRGDRLIPYYLARELEARQHQIDLIAFYQNPADIADIPRYEHLFRSVELIREPARSNAEYLRRMRNRTARFPTAADQSWSPEMWAAIEAAIQTHSYEMVHLFGGIQVYEYRNLVRRIPNIIVPYESFTLWLERAVASEKRRAARVSKQLQLRIARSFESWMFEGYDRAVVLTEKDAEALRALNAKLPLAVIPNGVDMDYFTPTGYEPEKPTLMFIGNYDYAPNLDAALRLARDLFPQIKQQMPQTRLYLIGGYAPPELEALASESITITGRVPDLRPYFEMAMVFVSALRLGAGIKNKVLEAMAMQTPVVATPLSCDGIPVAHGKHVVLGETDDELVQGVLQLLRDPRARNLLRQNGRALIEHQFTWNRVADQYDTLYDQVIREHRGYTGVSRA
jgi:polysaccharide biosynthesis protein PslH